MKFPTGPSTILAQKNCKKKIGEVLARRITTNRPFHNFRASLAGGRRKVCSSRASCDGFWSSKVVKGSVGHSWFRLRLKPATLTKFLFPSSESTRDESSARWRRNSTKWILCDEFFYINKYAGFFQCLYFVRLIKLNRYLFRQLLFKRSIQTSVLQHRHYYFFKSVNIEFAGWLRKINIFIQSNRVHGVYFATELWSKFTVSLSHQKFTMNRTTVAHKS